MVRSRAGFTLIEILAVVVIMMILAAILLPVLGRAGEQSRRTQCMTNLHQISIALKMYKLDQRGYPRDLSEYPIQAGDRWFGSQDATTLLPDHKRPGYGLAAVYPDYLESVKSFYCPDNGVDSLTDTGEPSGDVTKPVTATYDSYDGVDPLVHTGSLSANEMLKYRRFWRDAPTGGAAPDPQYRRQLSWRYPPDDTVVTWCIYHRNISDPSDAKAGDIAKQKGSYDIVLYLDGTTKVMPSLGGSGHASTPGDGG